jgi:hypothetical protein
MSSILEKRCGDCQLAVQWWGLRSDPLFWTALIWGDAGVVRRCGPRFGRCGLQIPCLQLAHRYRCCRTAPASPTGIGAELYNLGSTHNPVAVRLAGGGASEVAFVKERRRRCCQTRSKSALVTFALFESDPLSARKGESASPPIMNTHVKPKAT